MPSRCSASPHAWLCAVRALLWAAHEADLTGASLDVVMAREMPFASYGRMIRVPDVDYAAEAERQAMRQYPGSI